MVTFPSWSLGTRLTIVQVVKAKLELPEEGYVPKLELGNET
jgi:hypothetical protein